MNKKGLIVLIVSIISLLAIMLSGCSKAITSTISLAGTGTTQTSQTTTKEKSYACLSPIGVQPPVTIVALAKRLDTIKGKTIYVNQGEADPVIMPALWTKLTTDYPDTDWHLIASSSFGPAAPEDEVKQNAKAVIRGNAWSSGATYAEAAYTALTEKAGIPCTLLGFSDQEAQAHSIALNFGCPNIRYIVTPRVGQGAERVATFYDKVIPSLTDALTAKELETGLYTPPPDPRICFTGTLDDAQAFFQKTSPINSCKNCPIAQWTDGIPVIIPTEDAVKEMLTGTSHKAEEFISYTASQNVTLSTTGIRIAVNKGDRMMFMPMNWGATVEKIAVNAVMAGCKPAYLPVVLAASSKGSNFMTTNTPIGYCLYLSGPIVKDLGANYKQPFQVGNTPLATIGRAYELIMQNIGNSAQGSSNTNLGHPDNRTGLCFAEDADSLPAGWQGQNELSTYTDVNNVNKTGTKTSNLVFVGNTRSVIDMNFSSQSFQNLNKGVGDLARALGVEGKPGNYNIISYVLPALIGQTGTGGLPTFVVSPGIAKSLADAGFTSKAAVSTWAAANDWMTLGDYKRMGWFDYATSGGLATIKLEGRYGTDNTTKAMKDAPDSTPWDVGGLSIIVTNTGGDECIIGMANMGGSARDIDPWR